MNIISGQNVDLITPFPVNENRRVFGWSRCYRTFIDNDALPAKIEPYTTYINQFLSLPTIFSWGVVDKNRLTNDRHEAPLVGLVAFELASYGGYLHFASARKAFKMGLMDEAVALVVQSVFESSPQLLRVGVHVDERNYPAKALFRALGFKFEGVKESDFLQHGVPKNSVMFGLTRQRWEVALTPPTTEVVAEASAISVVGWDGVDTEVAVDVPTSGESPAEEPASAVALLVAEHSRSDSSV